MSFDDVQAFVEKLNELAKQPGLYRLPIQSEWEHVAFGGEAGVLERTPANHDRQRVQMAGKLVRPVSGKCGDRPDRPGLNSQSHSRASGRQLGILRHGMPRVGPSRGPSQRPAGLHRFPTREGRAGTHCSTTSSCGAIGTPSTLARADGPLSGASDRGFPRARQGGPGWQPVGVAALFSRRVQQLDVAGRLTLVSRCQ